MGLDVNLQNFDHQIRSLLLLQISYRSTSTRLWWWGKHLSHCTPRLHSAKPGPSACTSVYSVGTTITVWRPSLPHISEPSLSLIPQCHISTLDPVPVLASYSRGECQRMCIQSNCVANAKIRVKSQNVALQYSPMLTDWGNMCLGQHYHEL